VIARVATGLNVVNDETTLRAFCARILGWATERTDAVEHALDSIYLGVERQAVLVLLGETDLVPLAHALHRRTLGDDQPFVVCDPHRGDMSATVRSPANHVSGVAGLAAATGGSLCVRRSRLPLDFSSMVARVRDPNANAQLIVCADGRHDADPFITLPVPIRVPSLTTRMDELPRIVNEYVADAIAELGAISTGFTEADRQWIIDHGPWTLAEIEKTTLRLVALRVSHNVSNAAARLGMAPVSLSRWIDRRKLRRLLAAT
jgi:hypothetical protein